MCHVTTRYLHNQREYWPISTLYSSSSPPPPVSISWTEASHAPSFPVSSTLLVLPSGCLGLGVNLPPRLCAELLSVPPHGLLTLGNCGSQTTLSMCYVLLP